VTGKRSNQTELPPQAFCILTNYPNLVNP